ncbi:MAG TPA: nucleotidyl transferase AbiEii/AbiGii toxin family protein [Spirochaetota bacterium]|nr:nucleotidyl transferase AbiEii/AbiGii toxin family protein [Spirochaetota bacterium]HPQ54431.1 nucleotidyl transferase AbiEii/AbiGii toxin family protein [Spirochaetota bacterium]
MRSPIQDMLDRYKCRTADEYRNALKEIIQEIALCGLSRGGFFKNAAFYGGTALRMFHNLDRFSEDLDFSLIVPDHVFDIGTYLPYVRDELGSYGFEMEVEKKQKTSNTQVQSAFIKGGTLIHLIKIASIKPPVSGVSPGEQLRIKFEIDTDPPPGAEFEVKYQLVPVSYSVRLFDLPSLFAGKLHALLCRNWKSRVKGRDYYDYLWYLSRSVPVNIFHLEQRMIQSGHITSAGELDAESLIHLLDVRFSTIDFRQVISDVEPFVKDSRSLELWDHDFFISVTRDRLRVM